MRKTRLNFPSLPAAVAAGAFTIGLATAASAQNEQFIPVTTYDTGPFAVNGQPFMDGFVDYFKMLNARDGGVGGVKLTWEECETEYKPDRFVECYEKLKGKGPTGAAVFNPLGTGLTYAVIDRAAVDKVPVISMGYGRTDATDGRVFPYIFPLITNYWSQNTTKIKFIGQRLGGMDKLKGKKIANLYHDSAYGKETIPVLDEQAKKYGYEVRHFAVGGAAMTDQTAIWQQIRQMRPDFVIIRGWGVMNKVAIETAARMAIPRDKLVGVWWSCAEQDTVPAGDAAKDYICASFHGAGKDFPVVQDVLKHVYAKGQGSGPEAAVGTIMWNRGLVNAMLVTEAIKKAQGKFGKKPLTGEQVRWGIENLEFTDPYIKDLGATGLMPPMKVSCNNHEGSGRARFVQWTGTGWKNVSDWIDSDQSIVRPMIEASSAQYAKEKNIALRDCSKEQ
jgi:branched-chain amino acid transport system substrate-binding protein